MKISHIVAPSIYLSRLLEGDGVITCFCDADGVLADFAHHVQTLFGAHPDSYSEADLWRNINSQSEFYLSIPLMPDARRLWHVLKPFHPIVLTGCPASNYTVAARQKVIWVKRHFGADVEVITCLSRDKQLHLTAAGDILIDDRSSNIKKWIKAGGIGIWHRDAETTIAEFQAIIRDRIAA
jgi:5'-nucleotidase